MLDAVATSLTSRQELIFQLVLRQGIPGQALTGQLGISQKEANDATYENQTLIADGFSAYVLARDGRRYRVGLASILDQSGWYGQTFTRVIASARGLRCAQAPRYPVSWLRPARHSELHVRRRGTGPHPPGNWVLIQAQFRGM
jgi:hypothetical protein